ncbi:protein piccolo isoform X7 [Ctenopharyngodon idella]|uniref:protein piccolo isoform X7 n=1 Tax=Ctenopharyngodon idella TaxID=7959 RepID=UPI00223084EC|nr:protein piccolo isoform X7 [Ctenopharyngodon idella]
MSMRHITIKLRGQEPRPHRCHADAALFTCPFCSTDVCKPRQYHQIMAHIAGHKLRAVEYGDDVIYSCNIGCGKMARHFHCCQCPKTYINKSALKKHLSNSHPIATCTLKQPASDPLQEPPYQKPPSLPQKESPSQQPASQPQQDPPSQQPASQPQQEPPSQKPASLPQKESPSQQPASQPQQDPPSQQPASQPQQEPPSQKPASLPQKESPSQQPASQPQQEPPSQQPASQPQQDPPSQQPASHPQQDPPSQQPASDPLQLAAPPAIKSHRRHITIKLRGQEPRPHRCHADAALFTCPFCSTDVCKPRQYHQIMAHIAGHKLRAVEYGDQVIYSCNIGCGKMARHFHCCQCPKTYINKADLKKHLCSSHPIATCTLKPQPVSDPQQEPPSQQPASEPQQEPPSQQSASQPQQEPPLQQPASPPLQLAAPPAIKRRQISVQCRHRHITIKQRGQEPQPQRCHADATLFTCPFCTTDACKPRKYHQIMAHIAGHKLSAVEYGDDVIYSCNSCGEKARHFHCCQCPQTYFNQGALKRHLCNTHPIATCAPEPQPVGRPLQEPPLQQPAPRPLELAAQRVIVKRKQISVQCPHCRVNLNSKNLKMHIKRKHHEAMHPVTPTWDSSHKVICDIDICKSCVETAPRSELLVTQCVSLSSVDYSCAAEPSEDLSEDMLTEME